MAKVILEFDTCEERAELQVALDGWRWQGIVWAVDQELRGRIKHSEPPEPVAAALQEIRDFLHNELGDENLTFSD